MSAVVEIIIVNSQHARRARRVSVSLHDAWPACVSRIVVVDNASSDGSVEMVRTRWPDVNLAAPRYATPASARRTIVALRQSQSPYVLLLNSDTVVPAGAIDGLRARCWLAEPSPRDRGSSMAPAGRRSRSARC